MTAEALMREMSKEYGEPYRIDFFASHNQWRVWWSRIHIHDGAISGELSGHGRTLLDALKDAQRRAADRQPSPCPHCAVAVDW